LKDAVAVLNEIAKNKFWGSVQFDFRDGEVTLIRKTETMKVDGMEKNRPNERTRFSE